jgi:hypothetical protein
MTGGQVDEVPDWRLERFLLEELGPEESEALRRQLGERAELRERLAALELSNAEILAAHPPSEVAARVRARMAGASVPPRPPRFRYVLAAAASLAVVAGAAGWRVFLGDAPPAADQTRVKGLAPQLLLFRKSPLAGVERLSEGSAAHDRDLVQLAYQAAGRRYGVVVSIDGRGVVTRHLPAAGEEAEPLQSGTPVALPEAYELDDAPDFEQFYLVAADEPFPVGPVLEAVRRRHAGGAGGGRLDLPPSMDQFSFVLRKESGR